MPKYNSASKDDKHPLYIKITKEKYPRVITVRKNDDIPTLSLFGPFPSSTSVYSVLRMLRRIFPFSDHKLGKRACIYSHMGLCVPCPNTITTKEEETKYLKNIKSIKAILSGRIKTVQSQLDTEMKAFSTKENFEEANKVLDQIQKLDYITQSRIPSESYLENPNLNEDIRTKEIAHLKSLLISYFSSIGSLERIECYDIAHLAGSSPTASMVTFIGGEPDKSLYRHFRIKKARGGDDYDSLAEVAKRRKKYFGSWGKPDLIIVDGGKGQVTAFNKEIIDIPVIGIAKRVETLIVGKNQIRLNGLGLNLIQRLRDEAHRFARVYHHKLVSKNMLN
jgi:excinuclease ABC subunit C